MGPGPPRRPDQSSLNSSLSERTNEPYPQRLFGRDRTRSAAAFNRNRGPPFPRQGVYGLSQPDGTRRFKDRSAEVFYFAPPSGPRPWAGAQLPRVASSPDHASVASPAHA